MKILKSNPYSFANKLKYASAVFAFAMTACGQKTNKPSLSNKSVSVGTAESPKVLMTCVLKQDSDERFFVYKTSKDQFYIANAKNTKSPLVFALFEQGYSAFSMASGEFGNGVEVASVKAIKGADTGFMALVANSDARTLEVVRYKDQSDKIAANAIPTDVLTEETEVLFSSKNCEVGETADKSAQAAEARKNQAKSGAEKAVDNTGEAISKGVDAAKANAQEKPATAEVSGDQAESALDKAKAGVKEAAGAIKASVKELGKDIKEEASQWVEDPVPSKAAVESIRELINESHK